MRLALVLLCLTACGPVTDAKAPALCRDHGLVTCADHQPAAYASILPAYQAVQLELAAVAAPATALEALPTDADALTQGNLLDGIGGALQAGNYMLAVLLGSLLLFWALRAGALKLSDAEFTWLHTPIGSLVGSSVMGFLLSVTLAVKEGKFTWATAGIAFLTAAMSALGAWWKDSHPGPAVAAAKAP